MSYIAAHNLAGGAEFTRDTLAEAWDALTESLEIVLLEARDDQQAADAGALLDWACKSGPDCLGSEAAPLGDRPRPGMGEPWPATAYVTCANMTPHLSRDVSHAQLRVAAASLGVPWDRQALRADGTRYWEGSRNGHPANTSHALGCQEDGASLFYDHDTANVNAPFGHPVWAALDGSVRA
jgi:hypothetical protein